VVPLLQGEKIALFPDTESVRAQRHLRELTAIAQSGKHGAALIFLVQRGDCKSFAPCWEKDPTYAGLLLSAVRVGVTVVALACDLDVEAGKVVYKRSLPVVLDYKKLTQLVSS
jgi:sugar fermentation stimulation protein A